MKNILHAIGRFFKSEWKRLLVIFVSVVAFYVLMLLVAFSLVPEAAEAAYNLWPQKLLARLGSILITTITYYVLIFVIVLPFLDKRKLGRFFLLTIGFFLLKLGYSFWMDFHTMDNVKINTGSGPASARIEGFIQLHRSLFFIMAQAINYMSALFFSLIIGMIILWNQRGKRQKELEKQKLDAELSAIKYQINPHFLFNSLSFIYSKTVPLSEEVSNAVMLLSDIMRYALGKEEDANGKVALSSEITHMKNVIEINQMRFNNKLNILYSEDIQHPGARITPLVLITLVENAFKHGDLSDPANPLIIQLEANMDRIRFYICNKKKKGPKELSTGIGIQNVRTRLELMYGNKYDFKIQEDEHFYITTLITNL
ncbi:sensor histidine kinase [Chitinophaga horti]|uniref:Sensor histidine kinase n=1 Tax=Chitinophaga horti TaxID=2920382 RepID=A0ABY6IZK9_9BACT|nr:sensor histidine kinase [Chitinophaga horti]UYQ91837.1 sensor histidine kinase [Chitinophaga horti]